ncbi:DNA polymerase/3'-5' exonuclease PolX [Oleiharenicola sp. Vm1]|uniref:DNA polymerase/3'-5' exonuclease PolX n=1 Tax=Oleiharenicola sp. Vm1 TaxID=3398393 RepID=UPI0039F457D5
MKKAEIAAVLTDIGTLLELKGENPFKIRAYVTGARLIESLSEEEIAARVAAGTLEEVKGIGEALAQKIGELHTTGKLEFYEKLKASLPPGLVELLEIPGVGPKKIKALHEHLGVDSIAKLEAACRAGTVAALAGFGEKTQAKILEGIANRVAYGKRHVWFEAWQAAEPILAGLRALPQVEQAEHAGSLRRRLETVGDLDFLVATRDPQPVADWFVRRPEVKEVTAHGETKASVRLQSGIQADLRMVPPEQFVFALHHFTGSKDHNVQMRHRALQRGLSMSEWGLVPAEGEGTAKQKAEDRGRQTDIATEEQLFRALGLPFIPPELREGLGEIEAAEAGPLPRLLEEGDLRGVFHNHTTESDGHNTLEEMTRAAQELGWEYFGVADHSKSSFQARGLDEARLAAQVAAIRKLNAAKKFTTHVFAGSEVDILPDGRLDFADDVLATLDYVVASVHSSFKQSREDMTARIIRAIEHPRVTMLGHLTGRLLLERPGYDVDADKVIDAAIAHGVIIELNAAPWRLDMDWRLWRRAAERGLLTSINPDAHATGQLQWFRAGVAAARKGWLTKENVFNTRSLAEVKQYLAARAAR